MTRDAKTKGLWIHRFAIRLFTLALAVLIFWVLGFLVQDLRNVRGPDYAEIEKRHVDQALAERRESLELGFTCPACSGPLVVDTGGHQLELIQLEAT